MAKDRKPRAPRRGCWIEPSRGGLLRFRFRWRLPGETGIRKFAETTALPDTPANRARLESHAEKIGAEIRSGTFDYLRWFPHGAHAARFENSRVGPQQSKCDGASTVRDFYQAWIISKEPPATRKSLYRDYQLHFRNYIFDHLGDTPLDQLKTQDLVDLRTYLLKDYVRKSKNVDPDRKNEKKGLKEKTVRNIIDGSLRAMVRDAITAGHPVSADFSKIRWGRLVVPGPRPFSEDERDRILDYFSRKGIRMGRGHGHYSTEPHFPYYAFLFTLFYTGMRPSEAAGLRIRSIDLVTGKVHVGLSRSLGTEAATKTSAAVRTFILTPRTVEILKQVIGSRTNSGDYLFTNTEGGPVDQANIYKIFVAVQRKLEIRSVRDLYATKDTFISTALTAGCNLTWLSEQTGVDEKTLRTHYGRFIHADESDRLQLNKIDPDYRSTDGARGGQTADSQPGSDSGDDEFAPHLPLRELLKNEKLLKLLEELVEQKGFEPSTPTLRT